MKDRIKLIREKEGMSRNEFGAKMYVSQDVINNVERGRVQPSGMMIKCICDTFGISEEWLRNGGDPKDMYIKDREEYKLLEAVLKQSGDNPMLKTFLQNWIELSESNQKMLEDMSSHLVKETKK